MNTNRNTDMNALFEQLKTVNGFKLFSRKIVLWPNVPPHQFPAAFLVDHSEDHERLGRGGPAKTIINADIFIYSRTDVEIGSDGATPSESMNALIDAIEDALAPNVHTQEQTLGGAVRHAWIEGRVEKFPGDLDGEGIAIVPVRLLVP